MTHQNKSKSKLLSLIDNNLVQFLLGLFLIAVITQFGNGFNDIYLKLVTKTFGYGLFFYLGTPFILHWLSYVSSLKFTRLTLGITIFIVSIYSYIFWDSYFFYKNTLGELFFSASLI